MQLTSRAVFVLPHTYLVPIIMILLETHRPGRVELCGGSLESQLLVSAHLGTIKYSALVTYETLNNVSDPSAGNNVLCWLMTSINI